MNIVKLKYSDKETAIADLIAKGVYDKELNYTKGVHAVVECGLIALENGTYYEGLTEGLNEGLNILKEPIYADGYHYDIMCEQTIDFGTADITKEIKNPKHTFSGYEVFN